MPECVKVRDECASYHVIRSRNSCHRGQNIPSYLTYEAVVIALSQEGPKSHSGGTPEREQKPMPEAKSGKKTVAGHAESQNGSHIIVLRLYPGLFGLCSGMFTLGLG